VRLWKRRGFELGIGANIKEGGRFRWEVGAGGGGGCVIRNGIWERERAWMEELDMAAGQLGIRWE
jgi:hypothetical protein